MATNICAHTQVLDSTLAVIVERDVMAYAEGILRLIENPKLRTEIGRRAQEYAQLEFSREGYLSKLESVYQALKLSKRISEISQVKSPGQARSTASVS